MKNPRHLKSCNFPTLRVGNDRQNSPIDVCSVVVLSENPVFLKPVVGIFLASKCLLDFVSSLSGLGHCFFYADFYGSLLFLYGFY